MFWIILVITLILSLGLIVMVLLQPSKGGGITAAFGGIGGQMGSTFGQRRTLEALGKGTTYTAIIVAFLCIVTNLFFVPGTNKTPGAPQSPVTTGQQAPNVQTGPSQDLNMGNSSIPATGGSDAPAGEAPAEGAPAGDPATAPEESDGE